MTKNELARELAVSEKLHLSTSVKAIDGIIRIIRGALASGEDVTIRGLGVMSPVHCGERPGRDFHTGQPVTIPAHRTVRFRPGKDLVRALNTKAGKEATL